MNTIILGGDSYAIMKENIAACELLKPIPFLLRPLRSFCLRRKKALNYWFCNLEKVIDGYDTIIVFDSPQMEKVCNHIDCCGQTHCRKILFFWNPMIFYGNNILKKIGTDWELWTFDPDDAKQYKMKYGGQFLYDCYLPKKKAEEKDSDLFFIGQDKGRFQFLRHFEKQCKERLKLFPRFIYVDKKKALYSKKYAFPVSYGEMLKIANKSKAILEINQSQQTGLTLRALEALFLEEKLVTNNDKIFNYQLSRYIDIFELRDDISSLKQFLNLPSKNVPVEALAPYRFSNWLKRIENNEEFDDFKNE